MEKRNSTTSDEQEEEQQKKRERNKKKNLRLHKRIIKIKEKKTFYIWWMAIIVYAG